MESRRVEESRGESRRVGVGQGRRIGRHKDARRAASAGDGERDEKKKANEASKEPGWSSMGGTIESVEQGVDEEAKGRSCWELQSRETTRDHKRPQETTRAHKKYKEYKEYKMQCQQEPLGKNRSGKKRVMRPLRTRQPGQPENMLKRKKNKSAARAPPCFGHCEPNTGCEPLCAPSSLWHRAMCPFGRCSVPRVGGILLPAGCTAAPLTSVLNRPLFVPWASPEAALNCGALPCPAECA